MRRGSIPLGRVLGVPLSVDLGVVLIGGLLTWFLAAVILPEQAPGLVPTVYWSVGVLGALLFLASLLAHELAHAIVARRNDVGVEGITLWLLGGFAQFTNEPRTPGAEFRITAAGPAANLVLGVLFAGAAFGMWSAGGPAVYVALLGWLGLINGFLGVLNLLPGAPLDGGRILAAALWKLRGDRLAGRVSAATVGKVLGAGLIGLGVFEMLAVGGFGGLWTVLIGWFLFSAARVEHARFSGERALGDLTAHEVMAPIGQPVAAWTTVADLVDGPLRTSQRSSVPVADWSGRVTGVVTMAQVRQVPAERWASTSVGEIATSGEALGTADAAETVTDLLGRGAMATSGHVLVLSGGSTVGTIGPEELQRAIEIGRLRGPRSSGPPPPPRSAPSQSWEPPLGAR